MLKLLHIIPTPFYSSKYTLKSQREISALMWIAKQNKIEFLLLESLDNIMILPSVYKKYLQKLREKRREMFITAARIIEILENLGYKASTFKTWVPFNAVPNDVDVIILDDINEKEFKSIVQELTLRYGYQIFDVIPYAVSIHDQRRCRHINPKIKDAYDIDLYYEMAANRIIYLDKRLLNRCLREISIENGAGNEVMQIYTLINEDELLTQLIHCVLPEQLFLLYHYYISLNFLDKISVKDFFEIAKMTHAYNVIFLPLKIVIDVLNMMMKNLEDTTGYRTSKEVDELLRKGYYRFKIKEITSIILNRIIEDNIFRRSIIMQVADLLRPKTFQHVTLSAIIRRKRTTY